MLFLNNSSKYLITLILLGSSLIAQTATNISARDLISLPTIRNVELNAAHKVIIYELREVDFETNKKRHHLWMMDIDGSNPRRLTYSSKNEWKPKISPDGTSVAFLSDRPDLFGEPGTRLWVLPMDGGEAKPVSNSKKTIAQFQWGADETIYYLCPQPRHDAVQTLEKDRAKAGFDAHDKTAKKPLKEIWSIDVTTREETRIFVGDPGVTSFDIESSGQILVYGTNYTGDDNDWVETDIFLFALKDSVPLRQLTDFKGAEETPRFSPDGSTIAYTRTQESRKPFSQLELETIDLHTLKVKRLTKTLDLTFNDFEWYNDQSLLLEVAQGLNNHIYQVTVGGQSSPVSGGPSYFHKTAVDPESPIIAAVKQTSDGLGEIVTSRGAGHPWEQLTNLSGALENLNIHPQTAFQWRSRDERFNIQGLVVIPHFSGDKPLPLIVNIHGGPASRTDIALEQYDMFQAWASQGFAVFSPNFRGSEGYSASFQTANFRDLGGGDYHDIMTGIKALINRGVAHPDSLIIMGGSYGGYMTNWIITQTKQFKAAVSRYGIYDLRNDFSNSIYAQWELDYLGKTYWEEPNIYRRLSPSSFISRAKTPTLILHGANDENTFKTNSMELARALKTLDVPHRFFLYPREGHGMGEPNHQLDVFNRQLAWVNKHLGKMQTVNDEDWLTQNLRIQVLSVEPDASFSNIQGETFLRLKLFIDGSHLDKPQSFDLSDIRLEPGHLSILGLPSGQFLARVQDFKIEVGADSEPVELELAFPMPESPEPVMVITGVGRYKLSY